MESIVGNKCTVLEVNNADDNGFVGKEGSIVEISGEGFYVVEVEDLGTTIATKVQVGTEVLKGEPVDDDSEVSETTEGSEPEVEGESA